MDSFQFQLSNDEHKLVKEILLQCIKNNVDNISRTRAYLKFYRSYPEIRWSLLAHMVSRNAGWNMCDLEGEWFSKCMIESQREQLFLTYERANWLIFNDVYPQLLIYHYSTKFNQPMFHLLDHFFVSSFIKKEWITFWKYKNINRLMTALIINEQNVIQRPVLEHPIYKKKVFHTPMFILQDYFHFSVVVFPNMNGKLYGASVSKFRDVGERIKLGKRLAQILFHKELSKDFIRFANSIEHTGSRIDYEHLLFSMKKRDTPYLRTRFPYVKHHIHKWRAWDKYQKLSRNWWKEDQIKEPIEITNWFIGKQKQIHVLCTIRDWWYWKKQG